MIKVQVSKMNFSEIEVLQQELELFNQYIVAHEIKRDFLTAITILDINNHLYYLLRHRLEKKQLVHTISFSASQAATILKCCNYNRTARTDYAKNVLVKLSFILDQELKSLV